MPRSPSWNPSTTIGAMERGVGNLFFFFVFTHSHSRTLLSKRTCSCCPFKAFVLQILRKTLDQSESRLTVFLSFFFSVCFGYRTPILCCSEMSCLSARSLCQQGNVNIRLKRFDRWNKLGLKWHLYCYIKVKTLFIEWN